MNKRPKHGDSTGSSSQPRFYENYGHVYFRPGDLGYHSREEWQKAQAKIGQKNRDRAAHKKIARDIFKEMGL